MRQGHGAIDAKRLTYVDAIRGVAAIAVVFTHLLYGHPFVGALVSSVPHAVVAVIDYGRDGVQAFFVLSGFVIVLSLGSMTVDRSSVGSFILRRQLRLDPPYWAMMCVAVLIARADLWVLGADEGMKLSAPTVAANMFYVHRLVGAHTILGVAWTLCVEIQLYLFVLCLAIWTARVAARRSGSPLGSPTSSPLFAWALLATGAGSVAAATMVPPIGDRLSVLFVQYWFYFAIGGLASLAYLGRCRWRWSISLAAMPVTMLAIHRGHLSKDEVAVGVATMLILFMCARSRWVARVVGGFRATQYLGSRSYSLYLVHQPVLYFVLRLGFRLSGGGRISAALWVGTALTASIGAAEALHRIIEVPSIRFAAVVKNRGLGVALSRAWRRVCAVRSARVVAALAAVGPKRHGSTASSSDSSPAIRRPTGRRRSVANATSSAGIGSGVVTAPEEASRP